MDKAKKKKLKRLIAAVCIVAVVAFLALMPLLAGQETPTTGPQASILTANVSTGSIHTEIIGGGVLAGEEAQTLTVPSAVKLTGFLVSNGQTVKEGDAVATVDRVSVMKAVTQVQETLDYLAKRIEEERDGDTTQKVTALAGGTVKHMYAKKGDSVQSVMLEHGALAVLSLDGLMAVNLTVDSNLLAGAEVTVTLENGKSVAGKVKSNLSGEMVVTLEDDDYEDGQTVQVSTGETVLGSGALYIFSPWKASAYAGTVSSISVEEGDTAKAGQTLMKLKDTGYTAQYHQLVSQRQEYEQLLLELFSMYQTLQLTAPCDGVVSGVDQDSTQLLSANGGSYGLSLLANAPNGDDETQYLNFVGKITGIGQNGWTLLVNPQPAAIADYTDLSGLSLEESAMTEAQLFALDVPVYERVENVWQQADLQTVTAGDILLFAFDSQMQPVWTVRVQRAQQNQQPSNPGGGEPGGSVPGGSMPGGSGSFNPGGSAPGGNWGGMEQEEVFEIYGLATVQIAQVNPQTQVTLDITVDEMDVVKLETGMTAQVKVDALGGEKCTAQITDISNTGTNNGGQSKFTVTLSMDRLENMLSGMNATAVITVATKENVLTVPAEVLVEKSGKTLVYTGYDEKKEAFTGAVEVTIGASDGERVEILSGLQDGQVCYYAYYDTPVISNAAESGSSGLGGMSGMGGGRGNRGGR